MSPRYGSSDGSERFEERRESVIEERARASGSQADNDLRAEHAQFVQNESRDQSRPIETHAAMRQDPVLGCDKGGAERRDSVELVEVR